MRTPSLPLIQADLQQLYTYGTGTLSLERCTAISVIPPVAYIIENCDVSASKAVFGLLNMIAQAAELEDVPLRVAAALTGVNPRSTMRSGRRGAEEYRPSNGRGEGAGGKERKETASKILGGADTALNPIKKQEEYYRVYAEAIVDYAHRLGTDSAAFLDYLKECGVTDAIIAEGFNYASVSPVVSVAQKDTVVASPALHPRQIRFDDEVREALKAAEKSCQTKRRKIYTSDILLALMDMPSNRIALSFDALSEGLAAQVHGWLVLDAENKPPEGEAYPRANWAGRKEVRDAQEIAVEYGEVTELHLLLVILEGESRTAARLMPHLDGKLQKLIAIVHQNIFDLSYRPGSTPDSRH